MPNGDNLCAVGVYIFLFVSDISICFLYQLSSF